MFMFVYKILSQKYVSSFVPRPTELHLLNLIPAKGIFLEIALISKLIV